jgi:hypothetical protein
MHLTEIIQNVIESESRGEHVMEPAPTPTPTPARHESTVVDGSPEPAPRKKRKLSPLGRKGTHERPIDIDSSDDDDEEDYEKAVKVKERDNSNDIKPMWQDELDSAELSREGSIAGKGTGEEGRVSTLARTAVMVPVTIIDARTSSELNPIRNRTPTSLGQRSAGDAVKSASSPIRTTHSLLKSTSHRTNSKSPKVIESDTANISTSTIPTSTRLPSTKSMKSASLSSTRPITPLSHAMLSSIHGKPNPISRPTQNLSPVVIIPHRSSPYSSPQSQRDPKATGDGADKDGTEGEEPQKSTSGLLDEDTAEFWVPPNESRCQSPVDISALRQQRQVATAETSDRHTISPIAATEKATLPTPKSTPPEAHVPLDLSSNSLSPDSYYYEAGESFSSNTAESTTSIIPANPPLDESSLSPIKFNSRTEPPAISNPAPQSPQPTLSLKNGRSSSVPSIDIAEVTPLHTATDTSSADGHLRTPHSAAVLRKGALGSGSSAVPIPHSTPAHPLSRLGNTGASVTRAPSRMSSNPANLACTQKPNPPTVISTIPPLHPSLPPKPSTLSRNKEYSALELSQFQTVLDNNGAEHRWLTIKRGFRSHDLRFSVTAETRAGLISQVFKNRGWLEGVYGSQPTNVGLYLDGKLWLPSFTVQQIGLWNLLAPGMPRSYLIEVELTYSSVMHA